MSSTGIPWKIQPHPMLAPFSRLFNGSSSLGPSRIGNVLKQAGTWLSVKKEARANPHRLFVAERAALGEKSFVSVISVDGRRFLIANAQSNVSLLTELAPTDMPLEPGYVAAVEEIPSLETFAAPSIVQPSVEKQSAAGPYVSEMFSTVMNEAVAAAKPRARKPRAKAVPKERGAA